jgi:hypothetical protein
MPLQEGFDPSTFQGSVYTQGPVGASPPYHKRFDFLLHLGAETMPRRGSSRMLRNIVRHVRSVSISPFVDYVNRISVGERKSED